MRRILAVLDFRVTPFTVGEILVFQETAAALCLEFDAEKVDIIWLCDPQEPARDDQGVTPENYYVHLSYLLPLAYVNSYLGNFMLMDSPACVHQYISDRGSEYAHIHPSLEDFLALKDVYSTRFEILRQFHQKRNFIPALSCQPSMLAWARNVYQRKIWPHLPVTVHMRNRTDLTFRNANMNGWFDFLKDCKRQFPVRFILVGTREEIEPRFRRLENVVLSKDLGYTVEHDCAFIQSSSLFLGGRSGISSMAIFSDLPYRIYNFETAGTEGLLKEQQFSWAAPLQKLIWKQETREMLMDEFADLYRRLEPRGWLENFRQTVQGIGEKLERRSRYGLVSGKAGR